MADRAKLCEPPKGLHRQDGTHWLSHDIGSDIPHLRPFWWDRRMAHWVEVGKSYSTEEMTSLGWVYECPVPTPQQIEALTSALAEAEGCFDAAMAEGLADRLAEHRDGAPGGLVGLYDRRIMFALHAIRNARTALAPFQPTEGGDG